MAKQNTQARIAVIDEMKSLSDTSRSLELDLRFRAERNEADRVWEAHRRLDMEIDILIGRAMDDWGDDLEAALTELKAQTALVDEAIASLQKLKRITAKVGQFVGYIDQAIAIAKKLLA
jgi:hypothetical protein